ncbi:MAG: hypothetical protein CFE26_16595 [Verrucomicrobiales bacterium VVV1]|nr:MAG: hypothetical protein CFE26_16595 [Verrucomicrobiales bacterium VVV1]
MARSSTTTRSGLAGPQKAFRRFFIGLVGCFVFVMATFSFVNTWVNPLWVTHAPWTNDGKFSDHRQIYRNLRTAKAGLARSKQWDVVFLGSSRVAIALDPALIHQQHLKTIFLGVDLTDLTEPSDLARNAGFYESPLNPAGDVVEREVRSVAGISSFIASVKTIKSAGKAATASQEADFPPYTALGHWLRNRSVRPARDIILTDSIPHAVRMIRQRKAKLEISTKKREALAHILNTCLERGIDLKILLPPNHSAYLSVFFLNQDPDPTFSGVRKVIVDEVAAANAAHPKAKQVIVWDFIDFHPLNSETIPPMGVGTGKLHYWADGTHGLETLGNAMLARMNGWEILDPKEADYGTIINSANLQSRLSDLRVQYDRYREGHPEEFKFVAESVLRYADDKSEPKGEDDGRNPPP